jgi:hypothetical protein
MEAAGRVLCGTGSRKKDDGKRQKLMKERGKIGQRGELRGGVGVKESG